MTTSSNEAEVQVLALTIDRQYLPAGSYQIIAFLVQEGSSDNPYT